MKVTFTESAWAEYVEWQTEDRLQYIKTDDGNVEIISCRGHYRDK